MVTRRIDPGGMIRMLVIINRDASFFDSKVRSRVWDLPIQENRWVFSKNLLLDS